MRQLNNKVSGVAGPTGELLSDEWNEATSELQNVITQTGQSLTLGDLNQLSKGIATYSAAGDFYTDSGSANAYVLSTISTRKAPVAYANGMRARFLSTNANTGASTVNIDGLGVKNIKLNDGSNPVSGQIASFTTIIYDSVNDWFRLESATETHKGLIELATQAELDALTDAFRAVTPAKLGSSFSFSNAASGYQKFLGGYIRQWGTVTTSASADVAVLFPIAFQNACRGVQLTQNNSSANGAWAGQNSRSTTGFNAAGWTNATTRIVITCDWEAYGY